MVLSIIGNISSIMFLVMIFLVNFIFILIVFIFFSKFIDIK